TGHDHQRAVLRGRRGACRPFCRPTGTAPEERFLVLSVGRDGGYDRPAVPRDRGAQERQPLQSVSPKTPSWRKEKGRPGWEPRPALALNCPGLPQQPAGCSGDIDAEVLQLSVDVHDAGSLRPADIIGDGGERPGDAGARAAGVEEVQQLAGLLV